MSLYYPEARMAIEVVEDPQGLPSPEYEEGTAVLYVSEEQLKDESLLDALAQFIRSRAEADGDEAPAGDDKRPNDGLCDRYADLLEAQDELARELGERIGEAAGVPFMLHTPEEFFGPGDDEDEFDDEDEDEDARGPYEEWLEDMLDGYCSPRTLRLKEPLRSVSVGSCRNLYLTM